MSVPIISIKGLGKRYVRKEQGAAGYLTFRETIVNFFHPSPTKTNVDYFWALKNINLDIYPGEIVGIIGRNGAGKSTLLKILSRITEPTKGEFMLTGRVASLLEVGTGFHPELSGRENIYLSGAILGMKKGEINTRFDEIVAFAGVEDFLDLPIKRYSSGMQVRLGFAVAAHLEADVLFIDEVLAVGDIDFQKKCFEKLHHISQSGKTILLISHNLPTIAKLCSKVVMLEQGEISMLGDKNKVIEYYSSNRSIATHESHLQKSPQMGGVLLSQMSINGQVVHNQDFFINRGININVEFITSLNDPRPILFNMAIYKDGIRIFTLCEYSCFETAPNEVSVTFLIPPILRPGMYSIGFGGNINKRRFDDWFWYRDICIFTVLDEYTSEIDFLSYGIIDIKTP